MNNLLLSWLQVDDYKIIQIDEPVSWRMTSVNNNDDPKEEIFHTHGILCQSDLPPLKEKYV
jgi:hypothetical protein